MMQFLKALAVLPFLAHCQEIIRVAVIWETNEFSFADSMHKSSFLDGFYFFNQQLAKKTWSSTLGTPTNYKMEMHTFDSQFNDTKITVDFKALIAAGQDESGAAVGDFHFMIGATAKKNVAIMAVGEELKIPSIHASGGNPAMWWAQFEKSKLAGNPHSYAFGMHLPFIGYTSPIIKAAADTLESQGAKISGSKADWQQQLNPLCAAKECKYVAILRPHGNFFQQKSAVAAVQWALDNNFVIIGPSKNWCENYGLNATEPRSSSCKLIGDKCRCIDQSEMDLGNAEVKYDPDVIPTVYEIDEKKVVKDASGAYRTDLKKDYVYREYVDTYKAVWQDVSDQIKALTGGEKDFVDAVVHWPVQYKSSLRALKELNLKPQFFLGWNGGSGPTWAGPTNFYDPATNTETDEQALLWQHGMHTFGFGQWFKTLTYSDPFFETDVAGILKIWEADMKQSYGYDEFGALTTGVVLYLAVKKNMMADDWLAGDAAAKRDILRESVKNVNEETLWGFVSWNQYQQNTGGGVSTTVAWQLQPESNDWVSMPSASKLVLPVQAADKPYVKHFASWEQRGNCHLAGTDSSTWAVEPNPNAGFPSTCRNCDEYGSEVSAPALTEFIPSADAQTCKLDVCVSGNYINEDVCYNCPAGQVSTVANSPLCDPCSISEYQDLSGQSQCKQCVPEISTSSVGSNACECAKGYYGNPGVDGADSDGSTCQMCPTGMTTVAMGMTSINDCFCAQGHYSVAISDNAPAEMTHAALNFWCTDRSCGAGEGLQCDGHDVALGGNAPPKVSPGYWMSPESMSAYLNDDVQAESAVRVWKCLSDEQCLGGVLADDLPEDSMCGGNTNGIACAWCATGFRPDSPGKPCETCDDAGDSAIFILGMLAVLIVLPLLLSQFISVNVLKQSANSVVVMTAVSIIGFNIMAINSLSSYSMDWQEPIRGLIDALEFVQLDPNFIKMQCVMHYEAAEVSYLFKVLGPAVMLIMIVAFVVGRCMIRGQKVDWAVCVNLMGMLFSFFFVAISVISLEPFRCGVKHPFGKSAFDKQPDVVCDFGDVVSGSQYTTNVMLGIFAMLFYIVLYFSAVAWASWQHQAMVVGQNQFFIRSTRFLFFRWKNHCYFWTMFWHGRALFVAMVPILTQMGSSTSVGQMDENGNVNSSQILQLVLLITLMSLWLAEVSQRNPWRYGRLNHLDRLCTFLFVLMSVSGSYQSHANAVHVFIGIIMAALLLGVIGFLLMEAFNTYAAKTRPKAEFFLCYHRGSGGIIARAAKFTIEYHSGSKVLLDIDAGDDLGSTIEDSRRCTNFIVVWTDAVSSCMSSAVLVTSAVFNQQQIAVLECNQLEQSLTEDRLKESEDDWSQEGIELFSGLGLTPDKVSEAFLALKYVKTVDYNPLNSSKAREESILSLLECCNTKPLKVPNLCTVPESADLFIIHDHNAQANAAAFVLKNTMRSLSFSIVCSSDFVEQKFPTEILGRVQHAVVLMTNGVLASANWHASLLALSNTCKILPVSVGSDFSAPSNERLGSMEKGDLEVDIAAVGNVSGSKVEAQKVATVLRTLFKGSFLTLSPAGKTNILNAEIGNILGRVKAGKRGTLGLS